MKINSYFFAYTLHVSSGLMPNAPLSKKLRYGCNVSFAIHDEDIRTFGYRAYTCTQRL